MVSGHNHPSGTAPDGPLYLKESPGSASLSTGPFAGLESRGGMQKADRCSLQISGAVCLFYKELHAYPGSSDGKEFICNAGDLGSIPGLGKIPWRRKWLPTPVFSPGKSLEQRSLVAYTVHGLAKSQT